MTVASLLIVESAGSRFRRSIPAIGRWPMTRVAGVLCLLIAITYVNSAFAQSPGRIPDHIIGYGRYTFGMSLDEAKAIDAGMRQTQCNYQGARVCLEKDDEFFGEQAGIAVLFSDTDRRLKHVIIAFRRFGGIGGACRQTRDTILKALFDRFGEPTKVQPRNAWWYAPGGGHVHFLVLCADDDAGMVQVTYSPSGGF